MGVVVKTQHTTGSTMTEVNALQQKVLTQTITVHMTSWKVGRARCGSKGAIYHDGEYVMSVPVITAHDREMVTCVHCKHIYYDHEK